MKGSVQAGVLALDIGTSSIRGALFNARGRLLRGTFHQEPCSPSEPERGASVVTAGPLAVRVEQIIDQVLRGDDALEIQAVAMSTYWHSLMGLDDRGDPQTDVLLWSDLRSATQAEQLRDELDGRAVHQRTGAALHPTFWPARLRWLESAQPRAFEAVRAWLSLGDYMHQRWFGRLGSSLSMASATGLLDQDKCTWDDEMLRASGIDAASLPPLHDLDHPQAGLRPLFARRWPRLARIPWYPALGDGVCSNIGVGCATPRAWAITVGTSAAIRAMPGMERVPNPAGLWRYRLDRHRDIMGGALNNGGNALPWLRSTLRLPPPRELNALLMARPWGSHGLQVEPYLYGERSPDWPLGASAGLRGLSHESSPIDITQAFMEAIASNIAGVARLLETALGPPEALVVTGGAPAHAPVWNRMLATALGRPLTQSSVRESSLRGAALVALETLGLMDALPGPSAGRLILPER